MVLWYKDGYGKPIYSFDVRGRAFNKALHWSDPDIFGPRAYFVTVSKPAALTLDGVQLDDEAIYRCRVDFRTSPTRNFAVNLTVIVPPHQLLLYDNSGRDVSDVVGPLVEGSDLVLSCEVRGGRPTPTVSWFMNERMVEGQLEAIGNHVIVNRLEVNSLTREHLNYTYKCQASNTKLMMPSEKTVRLELLLRPLSVIIINKAKQMVANEDISIQCEVTGSRPRAIVSWTRDNMDFRRGKILEEGNETSVINTITFVPVPEDDGSNFKCIGENPRLTGVGLEDSFKLNIVYSPQVTLYLGNTLDPENIKEGSDVYFECSITANPKEHRITWYRDGILVSQNMTSGVIISTKSLVLQGVTRLQSGAYTCLAANTKGETMSSPVILRVRYAPVCSKEKEVTVIGASLHEVLKVRCQVSADPTDVTFLWQFNNSGESFDVSPARFATSSGNISELMYTPTSQRDYGTLTCWGTNSIGKQIEPCVFQVVEEKVIHRDEDKSYHDQRGLSNSSVGTPTEACTDTPNSRPSLPPWTTKVVPAAKPSPLSNCTLKTVSNQTEIVEVECRAGYDGGLPQHFILEAYDTHSMRMRLNFKVSDTESPVFRLDLGELLPSPSSLRILVYAENAKGRSEKLILEDITLNDAEKRTDGSNSISLVPLAGLLTGSLLTLGMAVLVIVVVAIRRKRDCDGRLHCPHHLNIDLSKQSSKSRQGSMLEINTGDNRYVVAYTLKPATDCGYGVTRSQPPTLFSSDSDPCQQPDILNTPRGTDAAPFGLSRPEALLLSSGELNERNRQNCDTTALFSSLHSPSTCDITNTLGRTRPRPRDIPYSNFTTMRRDHIITDVIPGPESCV